MYNLQRKNLRKTCASINTFRHVLIHRILTAGLCHLANFASNLCIYRNLPIFLLYQNDCKSICLGNLFLITGNNFSIIIFRYSFLVTFPITDWKYNWKLIGNMIFPVLLSDIMKNKWLYAIFLIKLLVLGGFHRQWLT